MATLNLFPARVAIGTATIDMDGVAVDVPVMMTPEFFRALTELLKRVGGPDGFGSDDLAVLGNFDVGGNSLKLASDAAEQAALLAALDTHIPAAESQQDALFNESQSAQLSQAMARIEALEVQLAQLVEANAAASQAMSYVQYSEIQYMFSMPPVDWEHPGKIGAKTANTGAFTAITGASLVTTATVQAGTGFGCNGKTPQTAFALGAAATDLPTVITLANNLRTMSINNGIGS